MTTRYQLSGLLPLTATPPIPLPRTPQEAKALADRMNGAARRAKAEREVQHAARLREQTAALAETRRLGARAPRPPAPAARRPALDVAAIYQRRRTPAPAGPAAELPAERAASCQDACVATAGGLDDKCDGETACWLRGLGREDHARASLNLLDVYRRRNRGGAR
jgi:hypothetical protein